VRACAAALCVGLLEVVGTSLVAAASSPRGGGCLTANNSTDTMLLLHRIVDEHGDAIVAVAGALTSMLFERPAVTFPVLAAALLPWALLRPGVRRRCCDAARACAIVVMPHGAGCRPQEFLACMLEVVEARECARARAEIPRLLDGLALAPDGATFDVEAREEFTRRLRRACVAVAM
jgi:hypothetical protein